MQPVSIHTRQELVTPEKSLEYVYFPLSGVLSMVVDMNGGSQVEVGTVGNEGLLDAAIVFGSSSSRFRCFAQVTGTSLRMKASRFRKEISRDSALRRRAQLHAQAWFSQVAQSTACNARHGIEQRMCRWLLMTRDRVGADEFVLTQEFLAQMLGVRRPSVTVAAGILHRAGLVSYHRGMVRI